MDRSYKPYKGTKAADRAMREGIAAALNVIGADLTGKAQRLAPKDKGTLRASARWEIEGEAGFVAGAGVGLGDLEVKVSFDVPYAEIQHEREDFQHRLGQAKYLEEPLRNNALTYSSYVEKAIEQQLRRRL